MADKAEGECPGGVNVCATRTCKMRESAFASYCVTFQKGSAAAISGLT
jgi:hypothetical protein